MDDNEALWRDMQEWENWKEIYWRRYSNTFCTLTCNGCHEKGECSKNIGLIVRLQNWIFFGKIFVQEFIPNANFEYPLCTKILRILQKEVQDMIDYTKIRPLVRMCQDNFPFEIQTREVFICQWRGLWFSEVKSIFLTYNKDKPKKVVYKVVWSGRFQKWICFVGSTYIVAKMKPLVQTMHKLWTLIVLKWQELLLVY